MIGYIASVVAGYWACVWSCGDGTGAPNKFDTLISEKLGRKVDTSLQCTFSVDEKHEIVIHLHHWVYLLAASMFTPSDYFTYFAIGGIIHGVGNYDDWNNVILFQLKNEDEKKE